MPAAFDACVKNGGSVKTVSGPDKRFGVAAGEYLHICFLKGNFYRGEVKQKVAASNQSQSTGKGK